MHSSFLGHEREKKLRNERVAGRGGAELDAARNWIGFLLIKISNLTPECAVFNEKPSGRGFLSLFSRVPLTHCRLGEKGIEGKWCAGDKGRKETKIEKVLVTQSNFMRVPPVKIYLPRLLAPCNEKRVIRVDLCSPRGIYR